MIVRAKAVFAVALLGLAVTAFASAGDFQSEKAAPLPAASQHPGHDKLAAGQANAVQLLFLMDTDKDGRVSKQEWMTFMEKEFDRLDTNKDGYINVNDMRRARIRMVHPAIGK